YEAEYRALLGDGSTRWVRAHGRAEFAGEPGKMRATRMSGIVSDITEYWIAQEAQQLLTRELTHRVKNLFAIANGMVSMTARTAKDPKEMANALRGRLSALSRAHELVQPISAAGRLGAHTQLDQLIEAVLSPYRQSDNRISVAGPSIEVGPN